MKRLLVGVAIGLAIVAGCAKKQTVGSGTGKNCREDAPKWVIQGGAAMKDSGRALYGVGSVDGVRNYSLARSSAEQRARAEIQRVFDTKSESLVKDYMASTSAGTTTQSSEEQHIEQAVKTFSSGTLRGVEIVEHWTDPECGTEYALAKLDFERMQNLVASMSELDAGVKEYIKKNADKLFDDLQKESERRTN